MTESSGKKRFFDALAGKWDREVSMEEAHSTLNELLRPWETMFPGTLILDAGCGTGHLTAWLARLHRPPRLLTALDASPAMLKKFARRMPSAAPLLARAEVMPFRERAFDFVLAMGLYPHLDDPEVFLSKCREILRPGGWILILHTAPRDRINRVHHLAGPPVAKDMIPPASRVVELLAALGFLPGPWRDDHTGWLVSGKKGS